MAQNGVDISDIQRDFLSLIILYHLRLSLVLHAEVLYVTLHQPAGQLPPDCEQLILHSQLQVRLRTGHIPRDWLARYEI